MARPERGDLLGEERQRAPSPPGVRVWGPAAGCEAPSQAAKGISCILRASDGVCAYSRIAKETRHELRLHVIFKIEIFVGTQRAIPRVGQHRRIEYIRSSAVTAEGPRDVHYYLTSISWR